MVPTEKTAVNADHFMHYTL